MPDTAVLDGEGIKTEAQGGEPNLGFWDRGEETATWKVKLPAAGTFQLSASVATVNDGAEFVIDVAGKKVGAKAARTATWAEFRVIDLGRVEIEKPGEITVKVGARDPNAWKALNLRWVKLTQTK
jgi:hypothetical protein